MMSARFRPGEPFTRADVVATVRSLVGGDGGRPRVRWRHQGRDPETGLDCAGVVVWTAHALGHKVEVDFRAYERYPDGKTLRAWLGRHLVREPRGFKAALPGDVLLLRDVGLRWPLHVAFLMPAGRDGRPTVLHSWSRARGVVEHAVPGDWEFKVAGVYRFAPIAGEGWYE